VAKKVEKNMGLVAENLRYSFLLAAQAVKWVSYQALRLKHLENSHCLFHPTFLFKQLSILNFNHGFSRHFKCFMSYIFRKKNLTK